LDLPASRLQLAKAIAQFAQLHMVQATLAGALARKDKVQLEEQTKLLVDGLKKAIELVAELARRPEARKPQASEE
jgi:hypothetical protein